MAAISDATVLHKSYEKKEDKLQQKFEAQGLQNCRSRNVDLNFGTQGTNQPKENNREKKTKENFVHLYASWERERWTPPSIHGQRHHFLDGSIFGRNSTVNKETLRYPEEALSPPTPEPRFREEALACECPYIDMHVFLCLAFLWLVEITGVIDQTIRQPKKFEASPQYFQVLKNQKIDNLIKRSIVSLS